MYMKFSEWVLLKEDEAPEAPWLKNVRYGNYCGPGPYLNKQTCDVLKDGQPMPQPINSIDASCRQHDIDYCKCGASSSSGVLGFGNDCTYEADRKLVNTLKGLNQQLSDSGEKRTAGLIKRYFQLHNVMHRFKKKFTGSNSPV